MLHLYNYDIVYIIIILLYYELKVKVIITNLSKHKIPLNFFIFQLVHSNNPVHNV